MLMSGLLTSILMSLAASIPHLSENHIHVNKNQPDCVLSFAFLFNKLSRQLSDSKLQEANAAI